MTNVLKHIQDLESNNSNLKNQLKEAVERNGKLSAKTREGMQSALDTRGYGLIDQEGTRFSPDQGLLV